MWRIRYAGYESKTSRVKFWRSYSVLTTISTPTGLPSFLKNMRTLFVELAYQIVDCAMDIAKDTGKYQTVYPNKDGTKEINLTSDVFFERPVCHPMLYRVCPA
jgi:hypothetical protein